MPVPCLKPQALGQRRSAAKFQSTGDATIRALLLEATLLSGVPAKEVAPKANAGGRA
jgi:hypothetical protein